MDHSPLEHEVITLRAENVALKEQVAQLESGISAFFSNEIPEGNALAQEMCMRGKQYRNTIAQQAGAIRLKDVALRVAQLYLDGNCHSHKTVSSALAIQPSPEILQARDERVAEACKAACENERLGEIIDESDQAYENAITHCIQAIDSKEWRKYL